MHLSIYLYRVYVCAFQGHQLVNVIYKSIFVNLLLCYYAHIHISCLVLYRLPIVGLHIYLLITFWYNVHE